MLLLLLLKLDISKIIIFLWCRVLFLGVAFFTFVHVFRMVKMNIAIVAIMLLATSMSKMYLTKTRSKKYLIKTGARKMRTKPTLTKIEDDLDDDPYHLGQGEDEVTVIHVVGGRFLLSRIFLVWKVLETWTWRHKTWDFQPTKWWVSIQHVIKYYDLWRQRERIGWGRTLNKRSLKVNYKCLKMLWPLKNIVITLTKFSAGWLVAEMVKCRQAPSIFIGSKSLNKKRLRIWKLKIS